MVRVSTLRWVFTLLYLLNWKGSMLVWHARFLWICTKHTIRHKLRRKQTTLTDKKVKDVFRSRIYTHRASLADLDFNIHKSNSTYFSDADMARTDFAMQHFAEMLVGRARYYLALGTIWCNFSKEIKPFEKFAMETKLFCWDEKWLYLSTRFIGAGKKDHRAQSMALYVFKSGRVTVKPEVVLEKCGYDLTAEVLKQNEENLSLARSVLRLNEMKTMW